MNNSSLSSAFRLGLLKVFAYALLALFVVPAVTYLFAGHVQRDQDERFVAGISQRIDAEKSMHAAEKQARKDYYRVNPPSTICDNTTPEAQDYREALCERFSDVWQFDMARKLALWTLLGSAVLLVAVLGLGALAFVDRTLQYASFVTGWRLTTVAGAVFDDDAGLWHIEIGSGETLTARYLVNAGGVLTTPQLPDIDGVESFAGVTMHTARWDHGQDLTGKRVAIIGTGASAVQVIPEIAPLVEHLTVFQRTPIWCFPKADVPLSPTARRAMRVPGGKAVQRLVSQAYVELTFPLAAQYFTVNPMAKRAPELGKAFLRKQVKDPVVRIVDRTGRDRKAQQDPRDLVLLTFLQPEKRIQQFSVMPLRPLDSIREFLTREKNRK